MLRAPDALSAWECLRRSFREICPSFLLVMTLPATGFIILRAISPIPLERFLPSLIGWEGVIAVVYGMGLTVRANEYWRMETPGQREARERRELGRLKAKYEPSSPADAVAL